jgi:hypothetical protein
VQELSYPTVQVPTVLLCVPPPLVHASREGDPPTPARLKQEATDHLARWPALQVMAELLIELRAAGVPWWDAAQLRERWPMAERLCWLEQRDDLREDIVRSMTGLTLREGRRRSPFFQAELIDAVADPESDARRLEEAFDPRDLVVYGPVQEMWDEAIACIPWATELQPSLVEKLLSILVADGSTLLGTRRPPILSAWQLRTAIDPRGWQAHLPARVRAAVDDLRLHKELVEPGVPFTAQEELEVVSVAVLATSLPLPSLRPVFVAAGRVMGLEHVVPSYSQAAPKVEFAEVANDGDSEVTVSTG